MLRIVQAETEKHRPWVRELLSEYLEGICEHLNS